MEMRETAVNKTNKWVMNRAGIVNFWYYDEQYFEFADGKMLLRGSNGSGKSVTMQSLLPTLLDGKTDPTRLDSFGSRARKMEDYLLGEEQVSKIQERTGYLFLEFKRKEQDSYLTVGIGLQAKRGGSLGKWYFGITDGRRIGMDFSLFEELKREQLQPLSKRQLINRIAEGGKVMNSQKDYQEFVNERIFGFDSLGKFEDCIKLLMELRSPKLSREFTPTAIYNILTNALPALKEDDLQPVSRTLEQIDASRERLSQFEREAKAVGKIQKSYESMYEEKLRQLANRWLENDQMTKQKQAKIDADAAKQKELSGLLDALQKEQAELELNLSLWRKEQDELKQNEAYQLIEKGTKLRNDLESSKTALQRYRDKVNKKETQVGETHNKLEGHIRDLERAEKELAALADEMAEHAEGSGYLAEHEQHLADFERKSGEHSFDYWKSKNREYRNHLRDMVSLFKDLNAAVIVQKRIDKELGDIAEKLEADRKNQRHWQGIFTDEKEKLVSDFSHWQSQAHFIVPPTEYSEVLRRLEGLYARTIRFALVTEPIYTAANNEKQRISNELLPIRSRMDWIRTTIEAHETDMRTWKAEKDPVPERSGASQLYRDQLAQDGIAAEPFYSCIDFRADLADEKRNAIESALMETGFLDALLSEGRLELEGDRQLLPNPQFFKHTLADYLVPDSGERSVDAGYVQDILQSIEVIDGGEADSAAPVISEDGSYRLFSLRGKADATYQASYIGKASRERYRIEKIRSLEEEIARLQAELQSAAEAENGLLAAMDAVEDDLTCLPVDKELAFANQNILEMEREIDRGERELARKQSDLQEIKNQADNLRLRLHQTARGNTIGFTLADYEEAEKCQEDYQAAFHDWTDKASDRKHIAVNRAGAEELLSVQREELQEVLEEYDEEAAKQHTLERQLASNLELQKINNVAEITERIESCIRNIRKGGIRKEAIQDERIEHNNQLTIISLNLKQLEEQIRFEKPYTQLWRDTFAKEVARYGKGGDKSLTVVAEDYLRNWTNQENRLTQLEGSLDAVHREAESDLIDYRPKIIQDQIIAAPAWFNEFEAPEFRDKMELWRHANQIRIYQVNSEGAWRSPDDLKKRLEDQIEQAKLVLRRSDEELFEQIIFHSIGNVLRTLIGNAQKWVSKMNDILEHQDNSSGLTLSIRWKPKAAESDDGLSTARLVELLRKDRNILKPSDTEAIKQHFQNRIEQAKLMRDESNGEDSLYQVLQEVLDYRKWFSFELWHHRKNEVMKELSNNKFNQFSGGEKAIAMYLPLFTAMYSRYQDAGKDAPYIITLDEAFAGIDDLNIAELFKATEQLEFNYMMNSQALYGEYQTVSSLNTYELIRPKNAPTVSTIQYHWDGKVKTLLLPDEGDLFENVGPESAGGGQAG